MKILRPDFSLEEFYDSLKNAPKSILMLDYDGTLSPFTADRDKAKPYSGIEDRLEKLIQYSSTEIIIITGRDVGTLKNLLNLKNFPQIWGCHGAERFIPNLGYKIMIGQKVRDGLFEIEKWARKKDLFQYLESKPSGCSFHWRGKSESETSKIMTMVRERWNPEVDQYNLNIHDFDGGIEIRAKGFNKGYAVKKIMDINSPDFTMAYLGDDITDEDAFQALGNRGLKVLVRQEPRQTLADIQIKPPDDLFKFLDKWIELTPPIFAK